MSKEEAELSVKRSKLSLKTHCRGELMFLKAEASLKLMAAQSYSVLVKVELETGLSIIVKISEFIQQCFDYCAYELGNACSCFNSQ